MSNNYIEANKKSWDQRTLIHKDSSFYDIEGFKKGKTSLQRLELKEMGDVDKKKLIHLQCHFGQDTLSWAREGAEVTGVDFSPQAIKLAKQLAEDIQNDLSYPARFLCTDVFKTLDTIPKDEIGSFDIVFTSYGVISWLPDLTPWARVISQLLKPGGFFYIAEFHPMLWLFDDDFKKLEYPYQSNSEAPLSFLNTGTYADREAPIEAREYFWNQSLSTTINALINEGLKLEFLHEHMSSPYNIFPRPVVIEQDPTLEQTGYQIEGLENKIPLLFSLKASKPTSSKN